MQAKRPGARACVVRGPDTSIGGESSDPSDNTSDYLEELQCLPGETIIACAARIDSHIYRCESNRDPRHEQRHLPWNHVVLKPWVKM